MARRDSLVSMALRTWWARALVAITIAIFVVVAWLWAFRYFGDELDMEFVAWPIGIVFAILGYLLVGWVYRRFGPRARPMHLTRAALTRLLDQRLKALPDLTHTVHPIGSPWPKAVIGPTGVYLVEPVDIGDRHIGFREGTALLDGQPADKRLYGEVRRLRPIVEELLHERSQLTVPVYGVVAVDDSTIVPSALQGGDVPIRIAPLSQFPEAVDFGEPVASPDTVAAAAEAIERWRPATSRR